MSLKKGDDDCSLLSVAPTEPPSENFNRSISFDVLFDAHQENDSLHSEKSLTPRLRRDGHCKPAPFFNKEDDKVERSEATCASDVFDENAIAPEDDKPSPSSFLWFRINYVVVMVAIMLADGFQGTQLNICSLAFPYR